MTFYHELQLNQAGSKTVIRNAADRREKLRHIAIYLFKIAITMLFCMGFVMGASSLLGEENSIVGVVVLLFLMVFKNADFGICMKHSLFVIAVIFAVLAGGHTRLSAASPPSFLSYAGIIGGIGVGLSADYGWQSFFNSFGAMAVATGLIGLPGAIFFRILHNICGSLYGQIFYRFFEKSMRYLTADA